MLSCSGWAWLNANAGGITVIATAVVALATVILAGLTGCYVWATRGQLDEMKRQAGIAHDRERKAIRSRAYAVVKEIRLAKRVVEGSESATLLKDSAYFHVFDSLPQFAELPATLLRVEEVYAVIHVLNAAVVSQAVSRDVKTKVWEHVEVRLECAIAALDKDPGIQRLNAKAKDILKVT
jgi:3-methyladenine DNA glycosylase/8-oxoguanine DNA glycosylase